MAVRNFFNKIVGPRLEYSVRIGDNYFRMCIGNSTNAGSAAGSIELPFDRSHNIRLLGPFPRGAVISGDFNPVNAYLSGIKQDCWDQISPGTYSGDGIEVDPFWSAGDRKDRWRQIRYIWAVM